MMTSAVQTSIHATSPLLGVGAEGLASAGFSAAAGAAVAAAGAAVAGFASAAGAVGAPLS